MTLEELAIQVSRLEVLVEKVRQEGELRFVSHQAIHTSEQKALGVAADDMYHRWNIMNEFRNQLSSQAASFITRDEMEYRATAVERSHEGYDSRIRLLEQQNANTQGKIWAVGAVVGLLVTGLSVALRFVG